MSALSTVANASQSVAGDEEFCAVSAASSAFMHLHEEPSEKSLTGNEKFLAPKA